MGLDNGIILKVKKDAIVPFVKDNETTLLKDCDIYDICYWRKCWGIREVILKVLDPKHMKEQEGCGDYTIDAEDLPAIIRALLPFLKESHWKEHSESIWEYDEYVETLLSQIYKLTKLQIFMEQHKEDIIEVYFYDSY